MEEDDIVGEQTEMLLQVYGSFSKLFSVMPNNLQNSFLELGTKFDIDDDFNMLNEKAIEAKTYYAPDKFALLDKSTFLIRIPIALLLKPLRKPNSSIRTRRPSKISETHMMRVLRTLSLILQQGRVGRLPQRGFICDRCWR